MPAVRQHLHRLLRSTERYTKTDMVYLASSGFWINLGSISISIFSFILYLAFANFLPKEVYGTYQYLLSVGAIIGSFTLTGMNNALTRAVSLGKEGAVSASIKVQLTWNVLPLLGAWTLGGYYLMQGDQTLGFGLFLIGVFVPINATYNSYLAYINGRKDFRGGFFFSLFNSFLYYPALIVTAYFSKIALALLAANLASQAIGAFISYRASISIYRPNVVTDDGSLQYGKHLSAMGFLSSVAAQLDSILVYHFLGAAPLALYSFATAIPDRIASLTKFVSAAAFPKFAKRSDRELVSILGHRILWAIAGGSLISGVYVLFAQLIFDIFFPTYLSAAPYSMLYSLMIVLSIGNIFTAALTARGKVVPLYVLNTTMPLIQLSFLTYGAIFFGLWGLIVGRLIAALLQLILSGGILYFSAYSTPINSLR